MNVGGIMKNFDSRTYSINDFVEWYKRNQLELSPKFQRRTVWSPQAKSYLIDTILCGKPIPKFFIRSTTDPETRVTVREMVDGQQRMRSILEFIDDGFKVRKVHNKEYGGLLFSELPIDVQKDFLNYELSVDLLIELDDGDVLDIFARLNAYSVKLNRQELLNAKYFGSFKMLVYRLSYEYTKFWENSGIFSNNNIIRMQEAALTSDIVASMAENSIVDSKNLEKVYKKYDEEFSREEELEKHYKWVMDFIGALFVHRNLKDSVFARQPLFFSLFMTLYFMKYGLNGINSTRKTIGENNISKVQSFIDHIEYLINDEDEVNRNQQNRDFMNSISKATTDERIRVVRTEYLCNTLYQFLS